MVDAVTTNDDSLTARPYMQKGKTVTLLTFTNECYDVLCEVTLPGIVTLSKL